MLSDTLHMFLCFYLGCSGKPHLCCTDLTKMSCSFLCLSLCVATRCTTDPAVPGPAVVPEQGCAISSCAVCVCGACPWFAGEIISMSPWGAVYSLLWSKVFRSTIVAFFCRALHEMLTCPSTQSYMIKCWRGFKLLNTVHRAVFTMWFLCYSWRRMEKSRKSGLKLSTKASHTKPRLDHGVLPVVVNVTEENQS